MSEPSVIHLPKGDDGGIVVEQVPPPGAGEATGPLAGYQATGLVPPLGWVRFEAVDDSRLAVACRLDGDSPSPGIAPGWQRQTRPGRTAMTHWAGRDGLELPIGVVLRDDFKKSVEDEADILQRLAGRDIN